MKIFLVHLFTIGLFFSSGVFAETGFEKSLLTPAKECPDLTCVRNNIDIIDEKLVQLIGKRLTYVKQAGVLKKNKRPIYDEAGEAMILKRVAQLAKQEGASVSLILNVYKTLLAQANLYEQQDEDKENIAILKNMFTNFAEKKDIKKIDDYYSQDFSLVSNNEHFDYPTYKKQQKEIFKTLKSLKVIRYDDIFSNNNKVTARMVIQLIEKNGKTHTFYVFIIARIKDHKIDRAWEVTYPSWSDKLPSGK